MAQNPFDQFDAPAPQPVQISPANPTLPGQVQGQGLSNAEKAATLPYAAPKAAADSVRAQQQVQDRPFERGDKLRGDFSGDPRVKEYNAIIPQLMAGLQTAPNAQGDSSLIYAYAKVMDPGSVVREAEGQMAANTASFWDAKVEQLKKNLGWDGARGLPPKAAQGLRLEMNRKAAQLAKTYGVARADYQRRAERQGVNPDDVVGGFPGEPFFKRYDQLRARGFGDGQAMQLTGAIERAQDGGKNTIPPEEIKAAEDFYRAGGTDPVQVSAPQSNAQPGSYEDSYLSQILSGINKGVLANTAGAPVDIVNQILGLGAKGVNALANTDLAVSDKPIMGSDWIMDQLSRAGAVGRPSQDPSKQFVRRVGESVGGAAIPAGMTARTGGQLASMIASGVGGGIGAATAQRVAPGNQFAEMAGEFIGGGIPAAGAINNIRRLGQRAIEDSVPTVDQLKSQASQLYQRAEQNGVTASPDQTQQLQQTLTGLLRDEGRISPMGRLTEVMPNVKEGYSLVSDYANQQMNPTQMQTVRKVLGDLPPTASPDERRLAGNMLDEFDQWANPMAPELPEARNIASRYINAQKIQRAKDLADARASQFSQSGKENALRTEFRGLDRDIVKGRDRGSSQALQDAIMAVSRGTPVSNIARGMGKLAPTGAIPLGLGTVAPAGLATMVAGPQAGFAVAAGTGGAGILGRKIAENMATRNADLAELIARNGGALPKPQVVTPELQKLIAAGMFGQQSQYLGER